ncbi:MAG: glycoside hydrolase family 18 protein [Enterococcus sp.]
MINSKKMGTLLAASMLGLSLTSTCLPVLAEAATTTASSLTMDDATNVINGLNDQYMWSNDGGNTWNKGVEGYVFRGTQTVKVLNYDEQLASAATYQAKSYAGGAYVIYKNALWTNSYWAEANQAPGSAPMWTKVRDIPAAIATFNFNKFSDAEAEQYQKDQAQEVRSQKKVVGYFANWQGYKTDYEPNNADYSYSQGVLDGKGYDPVDIPFDKITHVNYGFMVIDTNGKLVSNDAWADYDESVSGGGKNYMGQVTDMADENGVTAMVSIGGWNNSQELAFDRVTATDAKMDAFTTELVQFMLAHNFDGVDIDWEYPDNADRQTKFIAMMKQLREKMTEAGKENDQYYQLTAAVTADHNKMEYISPEVLKDYVDNFNVMTYDFHGGFDSQTGHNSPLYATETDIDQEFNISSAMKEYSETYNIPKNQLMVGMSYYSRGFANVEVGELGAASSGVPNGGTWDDTTQVAGLKPWFQMKEYEKQANADPNDNLFAYWDDQAHAPYIYDADAKEFYTYDNVQSIQEKVNWTVKNGYGGAIVWELSYDTPDTDELGSIVQHVLDERPATTDMTIGVHNDTSNITMLLDDESFNSTDNYQISVNGYYYFHTQNGKNYYSTSKTVDGIHQFTIGDLELKTGDKVSLSVKKNNEGELETVKEVIVTDEMLPNVDDRKEDVTEVSIANKKITVKLKKEAQEGLHHFVVTHNGDYIMSSNGGFVAYSNMNKSSDIYTWTMTRNELKEGDTVEVYLAGDYFKKNLLSYKTITVTKEMLTAN